MARSRSRRLVLTLLLMPLLLPLGGCYGNSWRMSASRTMSMSVGHVPDASLAVMTHNGRIEVLAAEAREDVAIEARIRCVGQTQAEAEERLAATTLRVERDLSDSLTIKPEFAGGRRGGDGASIVVRLPGVEGVTADTSNGAVEAHGTAGRLVVDTSNGPVVVDDHHGDASIDTSNGRVTVTRVAGSVDVDTSNGPVTGEDLGGRVSFDTSNGSIRLKLGTGQSGPLDLRTSNGSVRIKLGQGIDGRLEMDTSNGGISLIDEVGAISRQRVHRNHAEVVLGEGGPSSTVRTSNGRVSLSIEP